MLTASFIMFSRSLSKDYRWLYSSDFLTESYKEYILFDYKELEKNKKFYCNEHHLIIRIFDNSMAVYKFSETNSTDQNSRRIFALTGCIFSGINFDIIQDLFKYIISYIFFHLNIFDLYNNISDDVEKLSKNITFDLNHVINEYKKNTDMQFLSNRISEFIHKYQMSSFIIVEDNISPILNQMKSTSEYNQSIDDILNNIKQDTISVSSHNIEKNTKHGKWFTMDSICSFFKFK